MCKAYGVEHTPMAKAIEQYYGFRSNGFYEAMQNLKLIYMEKFR